MAASPLAIMEQTFDVDKLSYEIFSILESKFLFGYDDNQKLFLTAGSVPETPARSAAHSPAVRVRILSIDGGSRISDAMLAGAALSRLESSLREHSGNPTARIADFFDVAAGSGAGGVLAAMLFARASDGRPLFSAAEALALLARDLRHGWSSGGRKGLFSGIFRRSDRKFRKMFGELTMKDTVKPLLIPCYDMATGAPFLFSRADAMESQSLDFKIREVCDATCRQEGVEARSVDGKRRIVAVGGGVAMGNPTAAAITHVLNNKRDFPLASGVEDLLVVSLGSGEAEHVGGRAAAAEIARITVDGVSDMVDQAVAMAFGHSRTSNYIRIQATGSDMACTDAKKATSLTERMLSQRNVESVLFRGKKLSEKTNAEKLDHFAHELMKEHDRRRNTAAASAVSEAAPLLPRRSVRVSPASGAGAGSGMGERSEEATPRLSSAAGTPAKLAAAAAAGLTKSHSALVGRVLTTLL